MPKGVYVRSPAHLAKLRAMMKSKEHREKNSISKRGKKNYNWKGDVVGYNALHKWVRLHLNMPKKCQACEKEKRLDAANRSGKYLRKRSDWMFLCRPCHMRMDREKKLPGKKLFRRSI